VDETAEITNEQLDKILADFSARGCATYLDDPALGFGHAATDLDDLGIPGFSPDLSRVPAAPVERTYAVGPAPAVGENLTMIHSLSP
jgi:hypothetical protein